MEHRDIQVTADDPRAFLDEVTPPVIFDEIQSVPELFDYVRTLIDAKPRRMGRWLFTGAREAPLLHGITESMAGRAEILQLLPFSISEASKVNLLYGGFPDVLARPKARALWFASYLQAYLERDVRAITNVGSEIQFGGVHRCDCSRSGRLGPRSIGEGIGLLCRESALLPEGGCLTVTLVLRFP